jgi:cytochrome c553
MDFKTGNRKTNSSMHDIANRLTDKEMKAVSDYMSALTSAHASIDKK